MDLSPTMVVLLVFGIALVGVMLGFPLAFVLGSVGLIVGVLFWGGNISTMLYTRLMIIARGHSFLAAPLFIFMGMVLAKSGVTERLFTSLHLLLGGFRGGLAVVTNLLGTVLASCVGVIGASVGMLGLTALPEMINRGYNKSLAAGVVCASGSLGILIPPSVMLIVYGPTADISVGKLFMAAFLPGFLLSALYMAYISVRCLVRPQDGPSISAAEKPQSIGRAILAVLVSGVPVTVVILAVLGSIFLGIATPTEAAAVGSLATILLAIAYRSLNLDVIKESVMETAVITSMVLFVAIGASILTGVFLGMGGGHAVEKAILAAPFGRWGAFGAIQLIVFLLGFIMNWIGIVMIIVPLISPLAPILGFDPVWFAMMVIINLQLSFITPPYAPAIFYLRGIAKPEWELPMATIIRGALPFIPLIWLGLLLCVLFPEIILWLPTHMVAIR